MTMLRRDNFVYASGLCPLALALALLPLDPARAATLTVANCNDSGTGSLRDTIAQATSGDTIDMTTLACPNIDLTGGAIEIAQHDLSLIGAATQTRIDAGLRSSVLRHHGSGTLYLKDMNITRGYNDSSADPRGGCLYSSGSIKLVDSIVHGCRMRGIRGVAYAAGAGIYAKGAVDLGYSRVVDNLVRYGYYGAVFASGSLRVFHSRICRNRSDFGTSAFSEPGILARHTRFCDNPGGALWTQGGDVIIENSTFSGNVGPTVIFMFTSSNTGSISIINSTVSGNTNTYGTPVLDMQGNAPKSIVNSTVAFNQQTGGCGPFSGTIRTSGPTPTLLDSTIVSNNLCNGTPSYGISKFEYSDATLVGANNLITGPSNLALPPDTISAEPLLAPLADNGGPTATHGLLDGSPAIDMGNNEAGLEFDQRGKGFPRVKGGATDIGAYER